MTRSHSAVRQYPQVESQRVATDAFPPAALFVLAPMALAYRPMVAVATYADGPNLIQALKDTTRYELAFAAILATTIAASTT